MTAEQTLGCDPEDAAALLRALAHPMRLRILCRLLEGECAVAAFDAELGLKQPNLSQQLAALRDAGLAATRREAKTVIYRLADARVGGILAALRDGMAGGAVPVGQQRPAGPVPGAPPRLGGEAAVFAVAGWTPGATRGRSV